MNTAVGEKVRTLGCEVDALTQTQARDHILRWLAEIQACTDEGRALPPCRYVVTPNLDHVVLLESSPELRLSYRDASLVLADGMPLVWAARLLGRPLPERVAGSDLTPAVLTAAPEGTKVFFLGASEASSQQAVENARTMFPAVRVVGRLSPPRGFENSDKWSEDIVQAIATSGASLVLVGFGAPKQEIWVNAHAARLPGTVVLCVGATIDFIAGTVPRAPEWARRAGVEWVHRLMNDPKRLARRYGKDAVYLPKLLWRDLVSPRSASSSSFTGESSQ